MFRSVFIEELLPRDIVSFNSSFMEGLGMTRFFGLFFLIGGIFLFLLAAIKFKMIVPSIIFLVIAGFGYMTYSQTNKRAAEREEIFLKGNIVYAKVEEHGRKFNLFKSSKDYTLQVRPNNAASSIIIVHKSEDLWRSAPIGEEILGLFYEQKYFFGQEMGVKFKLYSK